MPQITTPFYLDWTFWAVVVSAVALVLSQLPPIHQLLGAGRLSMEVHTRILLRHKVGNPNVVAFLALANTGGRSVRVRTITLGLWRDGKFVTDLPAQQYFETLEGETPFLLTSFSVASKDEWAYAVNFLNFFSRSEEKAYRSAELALKTEILRLGQLPENKGKLLAAGDEFSKPFDDLFVGKFMWHPGEYEIRIAVHSAKDTVLVARKYRFTLFESDSKGLVSSKDSFKTGDGIYWDSGNHPGIAVPINEL